MLPENKALFAAAAKRDGMKLSEWFHIAGFARAAEYESSAIENFVNKKYYPPPPVNPPVIKRPKTRPPEPKAEKHIKTFFKEKHKI